MAEPGHRVRRKRSKEEGGREGRAWASGHGACYHLLPHWSPLPQLPRSKVTGKRLCIATNRAHRYLMTPGLPWLDTHTPSAPPPPTPRRKTQQAASQRCSLDLPMGAGLPFRSPRASPGPRAGEGTQAHTRVMDNMGLAPRFPGRDSQDGKGSHCLNPHSPSLSISCSQRKGRPFSSERWFQTAGRGF